MYRIFLDNFDYSFGTETHFRISGTPEVSLDGIAIFDEGGIIVNSSYKISPQNGEPIQLPDSLNIEFGKKNKLDFSLKTPYLYKSSHKTYYRKAGYKLMLPAELVGCEPAHYFKKFDVSAENRAYAASIQRSVYCSLLNITIVDRAEDFMDILLKLDSLAISIMKREANYISVLNMLSDCQERVFKVATVAGIYNDLLDAFNQYSVDDWVAGKRPHRWDELTAKAMVLFDLSEE